MSKHPRRKNRISGQFAVRLIEMLESPAYRALSISGHKVLCRLEIELAHHGGNDNGKLPVTFQDFVDYGIARECIAPAIREVEALGFIEITKRGRGGNAEFREPSHYRITYAHARDSRQHPPTNEWKSVAAYEDALQLAKEARSKKSQYAVELGRRSWMKRKNKMPVRHSVPKTVRKPRTESPNSPVRKPRTTMSVRNPEPLSISWVGGASDAN